MDALCSCLRHGPSQNYTHFVVYTKSSLAEQTTPNSLSFAEAVAKYKAGAGGERGNGAC